MATPGAHQSLWIATTPSEAREPLRGQAKADVCVIGGGIVGITTALLLAERGRSVILLERGRILRGVTGKTTAKVTTQHGLLYHSLTRHVGKEKAQIHVEANEAARTWIRQRIKALGVDADYVEAPSYVYSTQEDHVRRLRDEADAAKELGLPATFTTETELPFHVSGAVRFDGQGHFHPRKYLLALAKAAERQGVVIHEDTPVTGFDDGEPCKVRAVGGEVEAKSVIVATNCPIEDRLSYVTRMEPKREYVLAARRGGRRVDGMYVNCDPDRRSVRPYDDDTGAWLVFAGESHPVGKSDDTEPHFAALERFAAQFDAGRIEYRWSTQDYYPVDDVPLVGRHSPAARHTFTATGFRAWGMTMGTASAMMMADLAERGSSPWSALYDPFGATRILKDLARPGMARMAGKSIEGLVGRRLTSDGSIAGLEDLAPGQGRVLRQGVHHLAVSRATDGTLSACQATCTHMGCIVGWNTAEQSWDCPCHGSRFAPDGRVLRGPATKALAPAELPATSPRT